MKLSHNVGRIDRAIRIALGIVLAMAAIAGSIATPWLYVTWVLAGVMLVTGAVGFCPLYWILGISTVDNRIRLGRHSRP